MEKTNGDVEKWIEKSIEKTLKNRRKVITKLVKNTQNEGTAKKCIKNRLGEPTFRPEGGFGSIFGSLEEPRNKHFERKLKVRKKIEKRSARR